MDIFIERETFLMLIWTLFIGHFVPPVIGEGIGRGLDEWYYYSSQLKYHFIRVHKNLSQHPRNYVMIVKLLILLKLKTKKFHRNYNK